MAASVSPRPSVAAARPAEAPPATIVHTEVTRVPLSAARGKRRATLHWRRTSLLDDTQLWLPIGEARRLLLDDEVDRRQVRRMVARLRALEAAPGEHVRLLVAPPAPGAGDGPSPRPQWHVRCSSFALDYLLAPRDDERDPARLDAYLHARARLMAPAHMYTAATALEASGAVPTDGAVMVGPAPRHARAPEGPAPASAPSSSFSSSSSSSSSSARTDDPAEPVQAAQLRRPRARSARTSPPQPTPRAPTSPRNTAPAADRTNTGARSWRAR